jgi:predicted ATPase/DNA-binding SARP family transcriptional activator
LGPLEIVLDDVAVPLGAAKERALLVRLLLDIGRVVSVDRLVEDLWEGEPPESANVSVRVHVSRIRKAFEAAGVPKLLVTQHPGYRIDGARDQLDATEFEELAARGRAELLHGDAEAASASLAQALELWRGRALADVLDSEFARAESARLEEARLVVLESKIDADLMLGRHGVLVGELEALTVAHPLRERLWGQRMVALYRAGRQADALTVYQKLRTTLVDELGLDPTPELARLEQQILAQDPALSAPSAPPSTTAERPSGVVTFLLTDIEGSTALWDAHPDAMADALERHDTLIAERVEAHGGLLLQSKGEGDSTVSVFRRASQAVAAAAELQDALADEGWPGGLSIKVRMSLHTGEAYERGGDYYGPALNRAARLRSLARGGQTLLSRATAELVRDQLPGDTTLVEIGPRTLAGLSRDEHVFELGGAPEALPSRVSAARAVPIPAQLVAATEGVFAGRDELLERLGLAWKDAVAGNRQVLFLAGEPGIGKTRLASEFARKVIREGATVLYGHCDEEAISPYQPFVEIVEHYVANTPTDRLRAHLGTSGGELARLVSKLASVIPDLPSPRPGDPEGERYRLFEAVADLLTSITAAGAALLLLDDLHWADKPTLLLLRHILRSQGPKRLLVLGAYRETDLARSHPLADVLADLHRERAYERLQVKGLDEPAVGRMVDAWSGSAVPEDFTRTLWSETEGNPFFVGQVLRHLEAIPDDPRVLEDLRIPESIREVVGRRMARLGGDSNEALSAASAIGQEFGLDVLERVVDFESDRLLRSMEEATTAGIVREAPGRAGRYAFVHALVRQTLYEELSAMRRARLHRRIGEALEAIHGRDLEPVLAELAHHFLEGVAAGDSEKAIEYSIRAGDDAMRLVAFEEAVTHYRNAIQASEETGVDDLTLCRLLIKLGEAQTGGADPGFKPTLLRAADLARSSNAAEELGRAAVIYSGLIIGLRSLLDEDAVELLLEAEEALPKDDSALRAGVLSRLAVGLFWRREPDRARAMGREALEMARRLGWPVLIAETHAIALQFLDEPEQWRRRLEDMAATDPDGATPEVRAGMIILSIQEMLELGDADGIERRVAEYCHLADEMRHPQIVWMGIVYRAMVALLRGSFEEGERLAADARTIGDRYEAVSHGPLLFFLGQMMFTWIMQGRLEEVLGGATLGVEMIQHPSARGSWAWANALTGRYVEARSEFEALAVSGFDDLHRDADFPQSLAPLSEVCVLLGDAARARALYNQLLPFAGRNLVLPGGMVCWGPNDYFLGILADTMGDAEKAVAHLETALEMCERLQSPPFAARTQVELARALSDRDRPGDADRARELATAALAAADRIGMPPTAEKARGLLRPQLPSALRAAPSSAFVGREEELEQVHTLWKPAGGEGPRAAFIAGEPGIGKTRLAAEFAAIARREGAIVLYGRSDEETLVPYQPFVEALRTFFAATSDESLRRILPASAGEIVRLAPELSRRARDLPLPIQGDPDGERYRLFEAVGELLAAVAQDAPVMLVLDDLHWADKPTLLLLKHLLRRDEQGRVFIVGTYRETELARTHPLSETLADLRREHRFERVILRGLTEPDVGALIDSSDVPEATAELTQAVYRETEGNPFFVGEVIRHLEELGETADLDRIGIPEGIKEVIGRRVAHLSEDANDALAAASVVGREFGVEPLLKVTEMPANRLITALEQAASAGIIVELPAQADRYAFSHALIRDTLYEELSASRRIRLHQQIAEALEAKHSSDLEPHLSEIAHHYAESARRGETDKAVGYAIRAGDHAMTLLAYEEAAEQYRRALQALELDASADEGRRRELLLTVAGAHARSGDMRAARTTVDDVAASARENGAAEDLARAALIYAGIEISGPLQEEHHRVRTLLEEAASALPPTVSSLRARVLARLAHTIWFTDFDRVAELSREALEVARASGDPEAIGSALGARLYGLWVDDPHERTAIIDELLRVAVDSGSRELELDARQWRVLDLAERGDVDKLDQEISAYSDLESRLRQPIHHAVALGFRAARTLLEGRFDEGEELAREAFGIRESIEPTQAGAYFLGQTFFSWVSQGTLAIKAAEVQETLGSYVSTTNAAGVAAGIGTLLIELGEIEQAREVFNKLAADGFRAVPRDVVWGNCMGLFAEMCCELDEVAHAPTLYDLLLPFEGRTVVIGPPLMSLIGPFSYYLGVLAETMRKLDLAEQHFMRALESASAMGAVPDVARIHAAYGRTLLTRAGPGDVDRAHELLASALKTAEEIGMVRLAARVRTLLRPAFPAALSSLTGAFVGRTEEFSRLTAVWSEASRSGTRTVLIAGEPGIGKTRLAAELARKAYGEEAIVLYGRSDEETLVPYQPFVEALRSYVKTCRADVLRAQVGSIGGELSRLVPEIGRRLPDLAPPISADQEADRYRLFEAVAEFLAAIARRRPTILVLDDLHWADKPTLLLLKHILRSSSDAPLLLVGTYRETELARTHPLADVLADLRRDHPVERLALKGLNEPDVGALIVDRIGGEAPEALTRAVHEQTEGNPFFVGEVLSHLSDTGSLVADQAAWVAVAGIPEGVREVVGRRLSRLSAEANEALAAAAVIGREFQIDLLDRLVDADTKALAAALEEARSAGLLAEIPGTIGGYAFSHALVRESLYEELSAINRALIHRRVAEAVEGIHEADLGSHLGELAYHFLQSARPGDTEKAIDYATRAAARAVDVLAYEEAVEHYRDALHMVEATEPIDIARRHELLLALGDAHWKAGDISAAKETLRKAVAHARAHGSAEELARAALLYAGPQEVLQLPAGGSDIVDFLRAALEALPDEDSALKVWVTARLVVATHMNTDRPRLAALSREALEMAERVGDPTAMIAALAARRYALWDTKTLAQRLADDEEVERLATLVGDRQRVIDSHRWRCHDLLELGDITALDREMEIHQRLADELRQPTHIKRSVFIRATRMLMQGRFEEGERLAIEALEMGRRIGDATSEAHFLGQMTLTYRMQGRFPSESELARARELTQGFTDTPVGYSAAARLGLARWAAAFGKLDEAKALYEDVAANDFADLPAGVPGAVAVSELGELCPLFGDARRSAIVYELLAPTADQNIVQPPCAAYYGPTSYYLGLLAAATGRIDLAVEHFEQALHRTQEHGTPPFTAQVQHGLAGALLTRAGPGDVDRAHELLISALATADELGMKPLAATVRTLLRPPLPSALNADATPFVGREPERARLMTLLGEVETGARRTALISGEPGIGKTRLASEFARKAFSDGAVVLYGRCDEDPSVPYQPFVEALSAYVSASPIEVLHQHVDRFGGDLGRVVPEFKRRLPHAPEPAPGDPEIDRYRSFEAATGLLAAASERDPIVLVLDDLHWAAKPTLLLLRHVLRSEERLRLFILGTYRETDLDRAHPLAEMLADLRRDGGAERMSLAGLDEADILTLLRTAAGHALEEPQAQEFARALHAETEGNPFFFMEILRHLAETGVAHQNEDGRWTLDVGTTGEFGLPEGVREAVARRLSRLSPAVNGALAVAAVAGMTFSGEVVERVPESGGEDVLGALEEARDVGILVETQSPGEFRFSHALIRQTLTTEISSIRRIRLHAHIAEAIEVVYTRTIDAHLTDLAHHFFEAAHGGDAAKAVDYCRRAGDQAMERVAYEEAAAHYRRALEALALTQLGDVERADLLLAIGRAEYRKGDAVEAKRSFLEAAELARRAGSGEQLAWAALGFGIGGGFGLIPMPPDDELIGLIEEALRTLPSGDHRLRVRLLVRLVHELTLPENLARQDEVSREALDMAERLADPKVHIVALHARQWALLGPDGTEERLAAADRMLSIAQEVGDSDMVMRSHDMRYRTMLELGRLAEARSEFHAMEQLAGQLREPVHDWLIAAYRATHTASQGRFHEAEQLAQEAWRMGQKAYNEQVAALAFTVIMVTLRWQQGRFAEANEFMVGAAESLPRFVALRASVAAQLAEQGRLDEARTIFDELAANDFADIPRDGYWLGALTALSPCAAILGDRIRAELLYNMFLPYESRVMVSGGPLGIAGDVGATFLGMLATTLGRFDDAQRHFEGSIKFMRALGARLYIVRAEIEYARMLLLRARAGDTDRASALLSDALASAQELGTEAWASRAQDLLAGAVPTST